MAYESQGIPFYWSTTTSNTTLDAGRVGDLIGFSGPSQSANVIDITNLDSTAKEKLVGVYDGGQITLNLNWAASHATYLGQLKLQECLRARTKGCFLIELGGTAAASTGKTVIGKGYVTGLNITGSVDNKVAGDVTIAITGGVSLST